MSPPLNGPLEQHRFPERLTARVVSPGARPQVHGYDVEHDLARHYGLSDLVLLSLVGELPTDQARAAFDVAVLFAAPVSVAHASTHAAVVARLCGSPPSAIIGAAAIGLAEQARALLAEHGELLAWLDEGRGELPQRFTATSDAEREAVHRLRAALPVGFDVPALAGSPTRDAAVLGVLHAVGVRRAEQLAVALVAARLTTTMAEALAERPTNFGRYPANLPTYRYQEEP
jgi:hypothetical protein